MALEIAAIAVAVLGLLLLGRWIYAVIRTKTNPPAERHDFSFRAMRDRRLRRRVSVYLGSGLLATGIGLLLMGQALS